MLYLIQLLCYRFSLKTLNNSKETNQMTTIMTATPWTQRIVLHDHLDGSATLVPILPQLFKLSGKEYPLDPHGDVQGDMIKLFKDPQKDIVQKFSNTTGVMQSWESLLLVARNYVRSKALQGFKYCELTIAPQYHVFGGLNIFEVVQALILGIKDGEKEFPDIEVNILFAIGREVSPDKAVELVERANMCDRDYVVGVSLVCDEYAHQPGKHIPMFKKAKELGLKTTCHAGEWCHHPAQGKANWHRDRYQLLKNIWIAVSQLEVNRLGHAIPLAYDEDLMKEVKARGIAIEGCPASNLSSGLIPNTKYLKIRTLLAEGINYSLNPDDDLFMPSLSETYQICNAEYKFTEEEKLKLLRNPWLARFGNRKEHTY